MAKKSATATNAAIMTLDGDQEIKALLFELSESLLVRNF